MEIAHTDPIYLALFTSWVNDWFLGGDIDYGSNSPGMVTVSLEAMNG